DKATQDPDFVEPRWKLARALYFKASYTDQDADSKKAIFEKARRISDEAITLLGKSLESRGIKGWVDFAPQLLAGHLKDRSGAARCRSATATSSIATSSPRRCTAATARRRPRPSRSRRRSSQTPPRRSISSKTSRSRTTPGKTSRPGRKPRSPGPLREPPEQPRRRLAAVRVRPARGELGQRREHEPALREAGMWQDRVPRATHLPAEVEDVD